MSEPYDRDDLYYELVNQDIAASYAEVDRPDKRTFEALPPSSLVAIELRICEKRTERELTRLQTRAEIVEWYEGIRTYMVRVLDPFCEKVLKNLHLTVQPSEIKDILTVGAEQIPEPSTSGNFYSEYSGELDVVLIKRDGSPDVVVTVNDYNDVDPEALVRLLNAVMR